MNIRYGEDILQACQAANLRIGQVSQQDDPVEVQSREGSTVTWGVAEAIHRMGTMPDIIYDLGMVGREAMVWVLGLNAGEVARKALMIRHYLSNH